MTLESIANRLVQHCREGTEEQGLAELYAPDAVSIEAGAPEGVDPSARGLDSIRAKHVWWAENFEVHSTSATGPFLHGDNRFAVIFAMDVTERASGNRSQSQEVAIYTIAGDKIICEEFFYGK